MRTKAVLLLLLGLVAASAAWLLLRDRGTDSPVARRVPDADAPGGAGRLGSHGHDGALAQVQQGGGNPLPLTRSANRSPA